MTIFVILLIYKFVKGTFEYEKVTRFDLVIIPAYSAVMMLLSFKNIQSTTAICIAIILLLVGVSIGFLQASKVKISDTNKVDSHQRPILKVKRNWPYLIGWLITFAIGIGVEIFYGVHLNAGEVSQELFEEVLKDLSVVALLSGHSTWFVWLLNVATSFTYGACIVIRHPKIRDAIRRKNSNKNKSI